MSQRISNSIVTAETDREACECVVRLMDKAIEIADAHDNEQVDDMILDQMYDSIFQVSQDELYNMYRYFLRLVLRLKVNPNAREFNQISFDDNVLRITNYDYSTYKWFHEHNYCDGLSNDIIEVAMGTLPPKVEQHLMEKAK